LKREKEEEGKEEIIDLLLSRKEEKIEREREVY